MFDLYLYPSKSFDGSTIPTGQHLSTLKLQLDATRAMPWPLLGRLSGRTPLDQRSNKG